MTRNRADEIFMSSEYVDELDADTTDAYEDDPVVDGGWMYFLWDGSMVIVEHDGSVTHEHEGRPWMQSCEPA